MAFPSEVDKSINPIDAYTSEDIKRTKRAGSGGFDILGPIKNVNLFF